MELKEAYEMMQANCEIEVGDRVKILRKARSHENGWDTCWNSKMDETVGMVGVVGEILGEAGIKVQLILDEFWNYPFFVLEIVEKKKKAPEGLEFDYSKFGCYESKVRELVTAFLEHMKK